MRKNGIEYTNLELWEKYVETKNGCDHNCSKCIVFNVAHNKCNHELDKIYETWNKNRHNEFQTFMNNYK